MKKLFLIPVLFLLVVSCKAQTTNQLLEELRKHVDSLNQTIDSLNQTIVSINDFNMDLNNKIYLYQDTVMMLCDSITENPNLPIDFFYQDTFQIKMNNDTFSYAFRRIENEIMVKVKDGDPPIFIQFVYENKEMTMTVIDSVRYVAW